MSFFSSSAPFVLPQRRQRTRCWEGMASNERCREKTGHSLRASGGPATRHAFETRRSFKEAQKRARGRGRSAYTQASALSSELQGWAGCYAAFLSPHLERP